MLPSLMQGCDTEALQDIAAITRESDVSPFELIHSGLVGKFLTYLTTLNAEERQMKLRRFLHVFINCPVSLFFI